MTQASPETTRARVPSPHHIIRDLALDVLFGLALIGAGLAGYAWLILTIGGAR